MYKFFYATACAAAALMVADAAVINAAFAQAAQEEEIAIEEVIVTAQRREESLQDVPITIVAHGYDALEEQDNINLFGLADFTPGLQIKSSYYGRNPVIYVRGVGINDVNQNFQGPVAVYQDEVFMASPIGQVSQMFDLERAEVLKGPQGTLFGRNTTGGAIVLTSRKPDGEFGGTAAVNVGDLDLFNVDAAVSFPITDALSARVAVSAKNRDGYQFNVFDQDDDGKIDSTAGRAILRYQPDDTWDNYLILTYNRQRNDESQKKPVGLLDPETFEPCQSDNGGGFSLDPVPFGACADALGFVDVPGPRTITSNRDAFQDINNYGATLNISKTGIGTGFGDIGFKSISSYQYSHHDGLEDVNTDPNNVLDINWYSTHEQFSEEFHIFSDSDSRLTWLIGANFHNDELMVRNVFEFFFLLEEFGGPDVHLLQAYNQDVTSIAGFADFTYDFTEQFSLSGGIRVTNEERDFDRAALAVATNPEIANLEQQRDVFEQGDASPFFAFPFVPRDENSISDTEVDWRAVLQYQPNADFLAYASASKAFKSGGFSGGGLFEESEFTPFDPEELLAYEVGIKSTWWEQRFRANVSAFIYDYKDLQVFSFFRNPETMTIGNFTANASDASIIGVDFETVMVPARWLQVNFGGSWLPEAEFENFMTLDGATGEPVDLSGNRVQSAPKINLNWAIQVSQPIGERGLALLRFDGNYNSVQFFENENRLRVSSQEGEAVINLRATYEHNDGQWAASFWVRNVTDNLVFTDVLPLEVIGIDQVTTNVQRTWGVELRANF